MLDAIKGKNIESYYEDTNTIENFIQTHILKSIKLNNNDKIYITNYTKKDGSLIIIFSIIVISSFITYGSIRQSIDYAINDLSNIFNKSLNDKYKINISSNEENIFSRQEIMSYELPLLQIINNALFPIIIYIFSLITAIYFAIKINKQNETNKIDNIIQKNLSEEINQKKLDYIFEFTKANNKKEYYNGSKAYTSGAEYPTAPAAK